MSEDHPTPHRVSREVAESEFERFCQLRDVETDMEELRDKDQLLFHETKRLFIRAMMRGALTLDEEGRPTYEPRYSDNAEPITFNHVKGSTVMAIDPSRGGREIARALAKVTKQPPNRFHDMDERDLKYCGALVNAFLS